MDHTAEHTSQFLSTSAATPAPSRFAASFTRAADPTPEQRAVFNEQVKTQAQEKYASLLNQETPYDTNQKIFADKINRTFKTLHNTASDDAVIFVSPYSIDILRALDMPVDETLDAFLSKKYATQISAAIVSDMAVAGTTNVQSRFGISAPTEKPFAAEDHAHGRHYVLPSSDNNLGHYQLAGLNTLAIADFVRHHEAWHALEKRYPTDHINPRNISSIDMSDLHSLMGNREGIEFVSLRLRQEAYADVAAIAEMLLENNSLGMELPQSVADWRDKTSSLGRFSHATGPVIRGFMQEVDRMGGIEKFRETFGRLDPVKREEAYFALTEKYGMSEKDLEMAIGYSNPMMKWGAELAQIGGQDVGKALDFRRFLTQKHQVPLSPEFAHKDLSPPTAAQVAIAEEVKGWDAQKALMNRAAQISGIITPDSITNAYGTMMGEMREHMKKDPENAFYDAKMQKLRTIYTDGLLMKTDYAEENTARGIDITPHIRQTAPVADAADPAPVKKTPVMRL